MNPYDVSTDPQVPGAYYYAPLKDNGTLQSWLGTAGGTVGSVVGWEIGGPIGGAIGAAAGGATMGPGGIPVGAGIGASVGQKEGVEAGKAVGQELGQTIGFYFDNASTILQNVETFIAQLNDYRSWMEPNLGDP